MYLDPPAYTTTAKTTEKFDDIIARLGQNPDQFMKVTFRLNGEKI